MRTIESTIEGIRMSLPPDALEFWNSLHYMDQALLAADLFLGKITLMDLVLELKAFGFEAARGVALLSRS